MELEPFDWNVVIAAYWNRAILTPNGIAKRLLKIPEGAGMEVLIPVDLLESPIVKYEGVTIKVEDRRLVIGTVNGSYEALGKALEMARNALTSLPDTPALAAGFNIRFRVVGDHSDIEHLVSSTEVDTCLSDIGHEIVGRLLSRKVRCRGTVFDKGIVTLSLDVQDEGTNIQMNFHRDSREVRELVDWLSVPTSDVEKTVNEILSSCGHAKSEEMKHV